MKLSRVPEDTETFFFGVYVCFLGVWLRLPYEQEGVCYPLLMSFEENFFNRLNYSATKLFSFRSDRSIIPPTALTTTKSFTI